MQVKTETKERFHVITVAETSLSASMAEELAQLLAPYLQNDGKSGGTPGNIILKLAAVETLSPEAALRLSQLQQQFYEQSHSFVICEITSAAAATLEAAELLEVMNVTPTESEAWDIVQMEEIERELLDNEFPEQ